MLPTVGSLAFPLQMFAARSDLSSFLVRDAAAKLGQHLPIYGGRDSRTELAMIRSTDELIEILDLVTPRSRHISPTSQSVETPDEIATIKLPRKTRWGQRIDRLAVKHILTAQRRRDPESDRQTGETRRVDAAA